MAHTYYHSWGVHSAVKLQFHICNIGEFGSGLVFVSCAEQHLYILLEMLWENMEHGKWAVCRIRMAAHYYFSRPFPCHFVHDYYLCCSGAALFSSSSLPMSLVVLLSSTAAWSWIEKPRMTHLLCVCALNAGCWMLVTVIIIIIIKWMEKSFASHIECLFDFNK